MLGERQREDDRIGVARDDGCRAAVAPGAAAARVAVIRAGSPDPATSTRYPAAVASRAST